MATRISIHCDDTTDLWNFRVGDEFAIEILDGGACLNRFRGLKIVDYKVNDDGSGTVEMERKDA